MLFSVLAVVLLYVTVSSMLQKNHYIWTCNNGAIFARAIGVSGNNYTSQLLVTTLFELFNKTVVCIHHSHYYCSNAIDSSSISYAPGI